MWRRFKITNFNCDCSFQNKNITGELFSFVFIDLNYGDKEICKLSFAQKCVLNKGYFALPHTKFPGFG